MKQILLLLLLSISVSSFSQVSVFEAKRTTDRAVVEKFIRDNPNHPAVTELKQKALSMKYGGNPQIAKPTVTTMTENKIEKTSKVGTSATKGEPSEQAKKPQRSSPVFSIMTRIKKKLLFSLSINPNVTLLLK